MSRSRLSHSSKLTKEGSRTGRAHCSDTWTQRERERFVELFAFSLLAAIWQNISKLKPLTFTCTRMSMHFLPGKIRDKWYLTLLCARWELGTKKRKSAGRCTRRSSHLQNLSKQAWLYCVVCFISLDHG